MRSDTLKQLSQIALMAGAASVVVSGLMYLRSAIRGGEGARENSLFVGLWAPSLFALSEMLDRVSIEDREFLGQPISHGGAFDRVREHAGR